MKDHADSRYRSIGADLRVLRRSRGMTLLEMAQKLGRSIGWMSQVERDMSQPSIAELRIFAREFSVPMSIFVDEEDITSEERGFVVRAGTHRQISRGKAGLRESLLSPDLTDDFEVVHSVFEPGSKIYTALTRPTQEVAYLVSGRLVIWIGGRRFNIKPGDSFRIRGESQRWANPYSEPAVAIWVISPPVY
jgi:transcriptional regulator with XRE-family HTH domain